MKTVVIVKHPKRKKGEVVEVDDQRAAQWEKDGVAKVKEEK